MTNKILGGMIIKRSGYIIRHQSRPDQFNVEREAMRAALLWLADNISDEMCDAADAVDDCATIDGLRVLIVAALRQAAGETK